MTGHLLAELLINLKIKPMFSRWPIERVRIENVINLHPVKRNVVHSGVVL